MVILVMLDVLFGLVVWLVGRLVHLHEFRLPPRSSWELRSSGLSRSE